MLTLDALLLLNFGGLPWEDLPTAEREAMTADYNQYAAAVDELAGALVEQLDEGVRPEAVTWLTAQLLARHGLEKATLLLATALTMRAQTRTTATQPERTDPQCPNPQPC